MFERLAVSALNHVLAGEGWARERLRTFSGHSLRLSGGPLEVLLSVDGEGYFCQRERPMEGALHSGPTVTIELPADTPFRLLADRKSILTGAKLSGAADFAEALAFVFRHLRWDVENDLSRVVGDVVAHRLVLGGEQVIQWQKRAMSNLAANAAEYLGEESGILLTRREFDCFSETLKAIRDDLARLEARLGTP